MKELMAALAVRPDLISQVARAEAEAITPEGATVLSPGQLAARSGISKPLVARARIVLVEAGLQSLQSHPTAPGGVLRTLHLPAQ